MRIGIVGAGAIGRWIAWIHKQAGHDVTLFCHSKTQADALMEHGILVVDGDKMSHASIDACTWDLAPVHTKSFDIWFVTVKSYQWSDFYQDWLNYRDRMKESRIESEPVRWVAVHNGVVQYDRVAPMLATSIVRSVCTYGLTSNGLYRVELRGHGQWLVEESNNRNVQKIFKEWRNGLKTTAIEFVPDIDVQIWRKLLVNASLNAVTALTRLENGQAWDNPYSKELILELLSEGQMVCNAVLGYQMKDAKDFIEQVCKQTYNNKSSMLQDLEAGRRTEIESINGTLLQMAETYQLKLPFHVSVYNIIQALQTKFHIVDNGA